MDGRGRAPETVAPRREYWPTVGWRTAAPQDVGMRPEKLAELEPLLRSRLRGINGARQVPDARVALAHNVGGWLGNDGAVSCVTILTREAA